MGYNLDNFSTGFKYSIYGDKKIGSSVASEVNLIREIAFHKWRRIFK